VCDIPFSRLIPHVGKIIENLHVDFDVIDETLITNSASDIREETGVQWDLDSSTSAI
jgi:hypothetical protein